MPFGPNLQKIWDELPENMKKEISARARELEEEYQTLQELRKSAGITQEVLSKELNTAQENISRIEKRSDMLISTLKRYVAGVGGQLRLIVEMPGKKPIELAELGDLVEK